jgi:hypothetical protein
MNEFRPLNNEEQDRVMKLALEYQRQELELRDLHELQSIGEQVGVKPEHVERAYAAVLTNTDPVSTQKPDVVTGLSITDIAMLVLNVLGAFGVAMAYPEVNNGTPIFIGFAIVVSTSAVLRSRWISLVIAMAWTIVFPFTMPSGIRLQELIQPLLCLAAVLFLSSLGARELGERSREWLTRYKRPQ